MLSMRVNVTEEKKLREEKDKQRNVLERRPFRFFLNYKAVRLK